MKRSLDAENPCAKRPRRQNLPTLVPPEDFLAPEDPILRDHAVYKYLLLNAYRQLFDCDYMKDFVGTVDVVMEFVPRRDDFEGLEAMLWDEYGLDLNTCDNTPPKQVRFHTYKVLLECFKVKEAFLEIVQAHCTRRIRNIFHGNSMMIGSYSLREGDSSQYRHMLAIHSRVESELPNASDMLTYETYQDAPMLAFFLYMQWLDPDTVDPQDRPHLGVSLSPRIPALTKKLVSQFPICVNLDSSAGSEPHWEAREPTVPQAGHLGNITEDDVLKIGKHCEFHKKGFTLYSPRHEHDAKYTETFSRLLMFDELACRNRVDISTTGVRCLLPHLVNSGKWVIEESDVLLCIDGQLLWNSGGNYSRDMRKRYMAIVLVGLGDMQACLWVEDIENKDVLCPFFKDLLEKNETWQLYCAERRRPIEIICPQMG